MKLPLSWLSDYTDISGVTPKEYDARLTMSGSKVEEVFYLGAEIENVVTGKVLSVIDHPDSDHLKICQLDVGQGEPVQIVTGAPNVTPDSVGEVCPVALHKSTLPGGVKIHQTQAARRGLQRHHALVPGAGPDPRLRTLCMRARTASCFCPRVLRWARISKRCSAWTNMSRILRSPPTVRTV